MLWLHVAHSLIHTHKHLPDSVPVKLLWPEQLTHLPPCHREILVCFTRLWPQQCCSSGTASSDPSPKSPQVPNLCLCDSTPQSLLKSGKMGGLLQTEVGACLPVPRPRGHFSQWATLAVHKSPDRVSVRILKPYVLAVPFQVKQNTPWWGFFGKSRPTWALFPWPLSLSLRGEGSYRWGMSQVLLWTDIGPQSVCESQPPVPGTVFGLRTFKGD